MKNKGTLQAMQLDPVQTGWQILRWESLFLSLTTFFPHNLVSLLMLLVWFLHLFSGLSRWFYRLFGTVCWLVFDARAFTSIVSRLTGTLTPFTFKPGAFQPLAMSVFQNEVSSEFSSTTKVFCLSPFSDVLHHKTTFVLVSGLLESTGEVCLTPT